MLKWLAVIFLLVNTQLVLAHDPGLSSTDLSLQEQSVTVRITFSLQDVEALVPMDSDHDAEVTAAEQDAAKPKIAEWVTQGLQLTLDGQAVQPSAVGTVNFDQQNNAQILLHYPQVPNSQLQLQANLLNKLPAGHKQFVTIKNAEGKSLTEKLLSQQDNTISLTIGTEHSETPKTTFSEFLKLGVEHIITGYDHLLFLSYS